MAEYDMILCGSSKSIFADALAQETRNTKMLHFENASSFTRWLFQQPRSSTTSANVLVASFREAKPCMDAIIAARSGDISKLRTDAKRPQLSEAEFGVEISAAVAEMEVVVQTREQYKRAFNWPRTGLLDANVRMSIVMDFDVLLQLNFRPRTAADEWLNRYLLVSIAERGTPAGKLAGKRSCPMPQRLSVEEIESQMELSDPSFTLRF